ncbi:hypothetical protein BHE74_00032242 [Ensete ventricosum]|nr:hypothetical protein BHE74_00032242 [Ensete ventricosum]
MDIEDNQLTGHLPISTETSPGLDKLINTKHLLFDGNNFTGTIPDSIGLVQTIQALVIESGGLYGEVPKELFSFTQLQQDLLRKFAELALRCLEESAGDRPSMSDVVKEIEMMLNAGEPRIGGTRSRGMRRAQEEGIDEVPYSGERRRRDARTGTNRAKISTGAAAVEGVRVVIDQGNLAAPVSSAIADGDPEAEMM